MVDEAEQFVVHICEQLREWVNHTKEGYRRSEESLRKFDQLWIWTINYINELELKPELIEEEVEFIKHVKYEGTLLRVHKNYKEHYPYFGINETEHYVSWTKSSNITDIYWVYDHTDCIVITAETTPELFGIDLVGYSEYLQKYAYQKYSIGSPAILKEQEVVFPIRMETINNIKINKK